MSFTGPDAAFPPSPFADTPDDLSLTLAPDLLALVVVPEGGCLTLSAHGEIEEIASTALNPAQPVLLCHAPFVQRRLKIDTINSYDLLELFAFTYPAQFAAPTISGLCSHFDWPSPESAIAQAQALWDLRDQMLSHLASLPAAQKQQAATIAYQMGRGGWPWAQMVLEALDCAPELKSDGFAALSIWNRLPEWLDGPPPQWTSNDSPPSPITSQDARDHLRDILSNDSGNEPRPQQSDYASAIAQAFGQQGHFVLAEAGTGTGKTLGYLAPAHAWSQRNNQPVWLSTYTRNLQRQLEQETRRIYPDADEHRDQVVLRKGRENYLCLLNYEEALRASFARPAGLVALGLTARWLLATQDGDLRGGNMPGWLPELIKSGRIYNLADRRGECLFGACPHYRTCFIEHSVRKARDAKIVIANHALIMNAAARGGVDEAYPPSHFIFDEGHHIFHAADSAFGLDLTVRSMGELRRWLLGGEGKSSGRVRGLAKRAEPLLSGDMDEGLVLLSEIRTQAMILPGDGWRTRLSEGQPRGVAEQFLAQCQHLVMTRDENEPSGYSLECALGNLPEDLLKSADALRTQLKTLADLIKRLKMLVEVSDDDQQAAQSDNQLSELNKRRSALVNTLTTYVQEQLNGWVAQLADLHTHTPEGFVDWAGIERVEGYVLDLGLFRRYIDPTQPFAQSLGRQAKSIVATSATLTDPARTDDADGWPAAEAESGALHSGLPILRARVPSPFNYAQQSRVLVVRDFYKADEATLATAYRRLFEAAGGGALGLFTSIERLKKVQRQIIGPLGQAGLPLYSQHVDGLDPQTLIDMFKADGNACLIGTDAIRDGVDVPGRALRLIVFDKIPWPRNNLLLSARKAAFGGASYSEKLTRQKLRQAFGRLIRRGDDRGVFVLLAPLPSKLLSSFPGVTPEWVSLDEAVEVVRSFLHPPADI